MLSSLKSELRKKYLKERKAMSSEDVAFLSEKIFNQYLLQFNVSENQNIHIFLPISAKNEINTHLWIDYFWKKNVNVFIPKMVDNEIISIAYKPDTELALNSWGILEPVSNIAKAVDFDQVITPLLYADRQGNRIGYGKGFYDRFFSSVKNSVLKIGINYFAPDELIRDADKFDIKLDYLVLPDGMLSFLGGPLNSTK
ncbi:5-formyltetrahydrofolate cyclo-ligase [Elizabethkingia anophelis]|uniref:5-formyltetrahydrofolate cyclo-ligase n=1 Tax=Elizabethkingia anophelis TaxID=1117645 RepID=UPI000C6DF4F8|nr:5-formyltetrahydrofolate cyclo-ligase [Elizabethkingia anophelis]MCT3757433.1 5-formyltetrahydrofolate cyclo-ligase [Elizabethkingia anophelis]MCT3972823.1 5-formyltetrahydrofolate cyclo-ligase [Elizabethkingia anophelis]MCT4001297.1 5-formyltetrahydrofolate cyclo-ligase [Elizabethkingia anophelis]MCT4015457.1 5-formyltetrahydrofolate cyclo-ligase [Elizabethkingia anophelis]MCT4019018.1 5-formyltetrahydrofolate cyclo-ligase [Elizabethkingia anophelis]